MNKVLKKVGRKPLPEGKKKKMTPVYLTDENKNKIVAKYGSMTKAVELKILPTV
jgi:hypothetical protein